MSREEPVLVSEKPLSSAELAAIRARVAAVGHIGSSGHYRQVAIAYTQDVPRLLDDLEALLAEPTEAQVEAVMEAIRQYPSLEEAARAAIKAWQEVSRGK